MTYCGESVTLVVGGGTSTCNLGAAEQDRHVAEVDAYVRKVMQEALDKLAARRRFPVLG
jgi:hypothetical protein